MWMLKTEKKSISTWPSSGFLLDESKHRLYDARKWLCLINILMRSTHMEVRPLTDTEHRNFKVKAHNRILDNQQIQSTSHVYYSILVKHTRERFLKKPWPEYLRRYGCEPKMQRDFLCPAVQVCNVTDEIISPGRKYVIVWLCVLGVRSTDTNFIFWLLPPHVHIHQRDTGWERVRVFSVTDSCSWVCKKLPEKAKI